MQNTTVSAKPSTLQLSAPVPVGEENKEDEPSQTTMQTKPGLAHPPGSLKKGGVGQGLGTHAHTLTLSHTHARTHTNTI